MLESHLRLSPSIFAKLCRETLPGSVLCLGSWVEIWALYLSWFSPFSGFASDFITTSRGFCSCCGPIAFGLESIRMNCFGKQAHRCNRNGRKGAFQPFGRQPHSGILGYDRAFQGG